MRESVDRNPTDNMLLLLIQQVNLDIFWSRESSTVRNALSNVVTSAKIRSSLSMPMENIRKGPWPVEDAYGFATAIIILRKPLDPGKNAAPYKQFDSIRKLRTGMWNAFQNSLPGCITTQVFIKPKLLWKEHDFVLVVYCWLHVFLRRLESPTCRTGRIESWGLLGGDWTSNHWHYAIVRGEG